MTRIKFLSSLGIAGVVSLASTLALVVTAAPKNLLGDWSLDLESGEPAWMRVVEQDGARWFTCESTLVPMAPEEALEFGHSTAAHSHFLPSEDAGERWPPLLRTLACASEDWFWQMHADGRLDQLPSSEIFFRYGPVQLRKRARAPAQLNPSRPPTPVLPRADTC